ncbi:Kelch repeat-containing protein [Chitinophaga pinensis]|uniref:kelch repeat-containing protein n=1 Tax=Chitinophaga pinensis TaxID=79329 RepID=UPI0002E46AC9|nr:kelch repeat-containing protein [Chitinophaga pinensis]
MLLIFSTIGQAQSYLSYGLAFNGHEAVAEKRTSFEIGSGRPICLSGVVRLEFDLNFVSYNHIYFGYILRIINENQNIDLIYDQRASLFRIISGQKFFNISFAADAYRLYNDWNKLAITLDLNKQLISLSLNDRQAGSTAFNFKGNCFRFLYGANDDERFHTRDIPPMRIKDIRIFNNDRLHNHWPLEEVSDTLCYDISAREPARVKNGVWLKPGHQYWKMAGAFQLNGNAVTGFDSRNEQLLIAGIDSIITYDLRQNQHPRTAKSAKQENILIGCQGIYDTLTNRFYNFYIDHRKLATYDPSSSQWNKTFPDTILTEYWHANKFVSPLDTSLYIIGGYGQLKYKNQVQRYQLRTGNWDTLSVSGHFFPPRYLAGLGLNATGDTAFIVGGYGSITGDQMLDPGGYYDLFSFDIRSGTFTKRFNLDSVYGRFTFANSLVIDAKRRQYYGLVFPKDSFNSKLQLIQGSLDKPVYKLTGTPIPYSFYDVQSFADLYYAPGAGKLVAVTLLYADQELHQRETSVKVYTIDFPPLDPVIETAAAAPQKGFHKWLLFIGLFLLTCILVLWRYSRKRNKQLVTPMQTSSPDTAPVIAVPEEAPETDFIEAQPLAVEDDPNLPPASVEDPVVVPLQPVLPARSSIRLFGPFQAFSEDGTELTGLFTPLMKELLLLILIYTVRTGQGITSDELTEILWNGKSAKDAKNNRSVNLAKLKSILEKIGNCMINKKSVYWQFQFNEGQFSLDYEQFVHLTKAHSFVDRPVMTALLKVIESGAFLAKTEYDWLDDVKAEVSNVVIDMSLAYLKQESEDPEFVIRVANAIFFFDRLNEEALEFKCKSLVLLRRYSLANNTYEKFVKDYRDIYGEEFYKSFNDVIKA